MSRIQLTKVGKKWDKDSNWLFKNLSLTIDSHSINGIAGTNGSGKSTLLKCLIGLNSFTIGTYLFNGSPLAVPNYRNVSLCAPWMDIFDEYSMKEFLDFHFSWVNLKKNIDLYDELKALNLLNIGSKKIQVFSSGMRQKIKLIQALFSDVAIVFLDEPTMNLDANASDWFKNFIQKKCQNQIIILASNDPTELKLCSTVIDLNEFKN